MFGDPTRRRMYLFARENGKGCTASEAAEWCEVHPNVARHHLDRLAAGGYLEVVAEPQVGKSGRPSKRYRSTQTFSRFCFQPSEYGRLEAEIQGQR